VDRDGIRAVQRLLGRLGYPVAVDGIDGPETRGALHAALSASPGVPADDDPETVKLIAELERDEGRVLHAYQDSLGFWTIGIGRLIDKRRGGGISNEEADLLKRNDIARIRRQLDEMLPWWRGMSPARQRSIQNMTFQLGIAGLLRFTSTLRHLEAGNYASAAANMRGSLWARQTPARAERVIRMIELG
jgi:lysozyme